MRSMHCASALAITATAVLAACAEPTGANTLSFFTAAVEGSVQIQYAGSGSFHLRPTGTPGPIFTVHSQGVGASSSQGFAFHSMAAPTVGERTIGALNEDTYRAIYWRDEGNTRKIFTAHSGTLRVTESTSRRVSGTFQLAAVLAYDCTMEPGFPAPFQNCEPAQGEATLDVTGSFGAGPTGGDFPGLVPYPG